MASANRERTLVPGPKAQTIVDDLIAEIRAGKLQPGDPLPTARELRERYRCSITPVREAMIHLKATGWAVGRAGVRVYVASKLPSL